MPRSLRWMAVRPLVLKIMLISGNPIASRPFCVADIEAQLLHKGRLGRFFQAVPETEGKGAVQHPVHHLEGNLRHRNGPGLAPVRKAEHGPHRPVHLLAHAQVFPVAFRGRMEGGVHQHPPVCMVCACRGVGGGDDIQKNKVLYVRLRRVMPGFGYFLAENVKGRVKALEQPHKTLFYALKDGGRHHPASFPYRSCVLIKSSSHSCRYPGRYAATSSRDSCIMCFPGTNPRPPQVRWPYSTGSA